MLTVKYGGNGQFCWISWTGDSGHGRGQGTIVPPTLSLNSSDATSDLGGLV